jgi:hypothetical protein
MMAGLTTILATSGGRGGLDDSPSLDGSTATTDGLDDCGDDADLPWV